MKLTTAQEKILRLLDDHDNLYGLELLRLDTTLWRSSLYLDLAQLHDAGYVVRRVDHDDEFFRFLFAITDAGRAALKASKRPGVLRRSWRRYVDEWRNDWLSMALAHGFMSTALALAIFSAWGFIP